MNILNLTQLNFYGGFLIDMYFQTADFLFWILWLQISLFLNTALRFQDEEEIWNFKFNI